MKTQLERELSDVLRRRAETTHRTPFSLAEIRDTSARMRRRRIGATVAGVTLAAVVALLGPVVLLAGDRDAAPQPTPPPTGPSTPGVPAVSGPGVRVKLSDAPRHTFDNARDEGIDLNRLVVHHEDIRAAVDVLEAAGARAISVNGQRIAAGTVIRGAGDVVVIDGVRHPQPFVIEAVGDPARLSRAIERDEYLKHYRDDAEQLALGWTLDLDAEVDAPAYDPPG